MRFIVYAVCKLTFTDSFLWKPQTDIPIPISIKLDYTEFECLSSASVNNRPIIYNQNKEPNPTGNILLTLNSKRWLVVLVLRTLLSNMKCLEMVHMAKWNYE